MPEPDAPETPETPEPEPEPETPDEEPNDRPEPPPQEEPEPAEVSAVAVEPRLAFDEFIATAPGLASFSRSVQEAVMAALRRWMRLHGKNADGHYRLAEWQESYDGMLKHAARI